MTTRDKHVQTSLAYYVEEPASVSGPTYQPMRSPVQVTADHIDAQIRHLADMAETAGMVEAAAAIAQTRQKVREFMHSKDREDAPY